MKDFLRGVFVMLFPASLLVLFAGCVSPEYEDDDEEKATRSTRILMIGNSFPCP